MLLVSQVRNQRKNCIWTHVRLTMLSGSPTTMDRQSCGRGRCVGKWFCIFLSSKETALSFLLPMLYRKGTSSFITISLPVFRFAWYARRSGMEVNRGHSYCFSYGMCCWTSVQLCIFLFLCSASVNWHVQFKPDKLSTQISTDVAFLRPPGFLQCLLTIFSVRTNFISLVILQPHFFHGLWRVRTQEFSSWLEKTTTTTCDFAGLTVGN